MLAAICLLVAGVSVARADCGDGIVDPGEQCDEGVANGAATSCCTDVCTLRDAGAECRPAAGPCDAAESCDGAFAACPADLAQPDATPCPDATVCNGMETCQGGICTPGTPLQCNDANPCTTDSCDPVSGCQNPNATNGTACPNATVCDGDETCVDGTCSPGMPLDCDDGNPCTSDSCDPLSGCQNPDVTDGTPCPDATVCNGAELCQGGTCMPGSPLGCTDSNPCTVDSCDPVSGCQHPNATDGTACPDATLCNGDETCVAGTCTGGTALDCDDHNPCTTDSCDPLLGCRHVNVADDTSCADGTICNGAETCHAGTCTAGTPLNCDDGLGCTADSCNPTTGCSNITIPGCIPCTTNADCNDGVACTRDACQAGACAFTPDADLCPDWFLSYKGKITVGAAKFVPTLGVTLTDTFESRAYDVKAVKYQSDPANSGHGIVDPVTHAMSYKIKLPRGQLPSPPHTLVKMTNIFGTIHVDTVKPDFLFVPAAKSLTGSPPAPDSSSHDVDDYKCYIVKISPNTPSFSRSVFATLSDEYSTLKRFKVKTPKHICLPVSRNGAPLKNPDRHLVCYKVRPDADQPVFVRRSGVFVHSAIEANTIDLIVEDEMCVPSFKDLPGCTLDVDCNDNNACTFDVCSQGDCQHANVQTGTPCSDGNACNGAETCVAGTCLPGSAPNCNDGNPCTSDNCFPSTGCSNLPLPNGTSCGPGVTCTSGVCG